MKVDNIVMDEHRPVHRRVQSALKSYHVLFVVAILVVMVIHGVGTVQRMFVVKNSVMDQTVLGYQQMISGMGEGDSLELAKQHFTGAREEIDQLLLHNGGDFNTLISAYDALLQISLNLTESAEKTLQVEKMLSAFFADIEGKKELLPIKDRVVEALALVQESKRLYSDLNKAELKLFLGDEYEKLTKLEETILKLEDLLRGLNTDLEPMLIFLGERYPHRVLLLFQNNNELRPTGGFIGSLGFIDLNDGRIENMQVHDVYDFDGQALERPPHHEISELSGNDWGIRDANVSPDFAVSARYAKRFLEEAKGPGVDSVIAIDLDFIRMILAEAGPLYVKDVDFTLTQENFDIIISYLVEAKTFGETTPKEVLKFVMADLKSHMIDNLSIPQLMTIFSRAIQEKHLLAYSDDQDVQRLFERLGASGDISFFRPYDDFLSVVNVSVGGNKSDAYVTQMIAHETMVRGDGSILDSVHITRTHTWNDDTERFIRDQLATAGVTEPDFYVMKILGKDTNKSMVRVYVPYGSQLESAIGVDMSDVQVHEEELSDGRKLTYYLFPMTTELDSVSEVSLTYVPSFELDFSKHVDDYRLFVDIQAGTTATEFEKYMYYASSLRSFAHNPTFVDYQDGELFSGVLSTDKIIGVAVGRK